MIICKVYSSIGVAFSSELCLKLCAENEKQKHPTIVFVSNKKSSFQEDQTGTMKNFFIIVENSYWIDAAVKLIG